MSLLYPTLCRSFTQCCVAFYPMLCRFLPNAVSLLYPMLCRSFTQCCVAPLPNAVSLFYPMLCHFISQCCALLLFYPMLCHLFTQCIVTSLLNGGVSPLFNVAITYRKFYKILTYFCLSIEKYFKNMGQCQYTLYVIYE